LSNIYADEGSLRTKTGRLLNYLTFTDVDVLYFFISFLLDIDNYILGPSGGRNEALCLK
jgi:hypothetical protein